MHHEICRFPSMHFYEGKLLSSSQMAIKSAPFHESAHLGPYMFFDIVDGHESHGKRSGSQSLYNESEADAAVEIMKFFVKRYSSEFAAGRIGVITPYKSQLSLLRSRFSSAFGPSMTADMEFNTVDGFQGREVDILILSTVRASISNAREHGGKSGNIGFVADVRRMNVALTRAKLSLWIVGNARTLQTNFHWYDLVNNAKERNLFMSVSRPYGAVFNSVPCLSKKDLNSPHLETRLRQQKKADFKDARHASQSVRLNTKEGHQRETKSSKNETKQDKRGVMHDHVSNKVDGRVRGSTDVLHGGLPHKHKNEEFTMKRRIATNAKGDLKDIPREKGKSSDKLCTSKERSIDNQVGSKTNLASGQLETDSSIKTLIKKAKCVQEISERSIPRNVNSIKAVISQTSTEGKHREKEAGDKERLHSSEETHRDIMSKRKRQRDAVDALLSSALISSKKPESLTKPAPNRPLSSKNARDAIKSTGSSEVHPSTNW
uniref:Putative ATP-dependent helicase C29A10.10c n=2 Tax=Anthurium amnicola TaxID=1678845 RepID=A0A1D1Z467_9ARAE